MRGSFTRGYNCKALTGKNLVLWIGGRLREVGAHGGSTVFTKTVKCLRRCPFVYILCSVSPHSVDIACLSPRPLKTCKEKRKYNLHSQRSMGKFKAMGFAYFKYLFPNFPPSKGFQNASGHEPGLGNQSFVCYILKQWGALSTLNLLLN